MKPVTITLGADDLEPTLRNAADLAALYSALLDYTTPRTGNCPNIGYGRSHAQAKPMWQQRYLHYKRVVEAFGVEFSPISEQEALTTAHPFLPAGAKHPTEPRRVGATEGVLDLSKPYPKWRGDITRRACEAAADRVVRTWRAKLEQEG